MITSAPEMSRPIRLAVSTISFVIAKLYRRSDMEVADKTEVAVVTLDDSGRLTKIPWMHSRTD